MSDPIPISLAVEDPLSEAVLRKLLAAAGRAYAIGGVHGKNGYGYLRSTIHAWNKAAKYHPFLVLTDLDRIPCAPALMADWLNEPMHHNLIFRVAVREVEAWLLADKDNFAKFLAVPTKLIPDRPDELLDPKATLVAIAENSRRKEIRQDLVPRQGSTSKQGPGHNGTLGEFVSQAWDAVSASQASPSLHRALTRLRHFQPHWEQA